MKYISEGNTLPLMICNWLETIPMQDELKKFISIEVDESKSNLLINCLKQKGELWIFKYVDFLVIRLFLVFRKYSMQDVDKTSFGNCSYKSYLFISYYVETNI